MSRETGQRSCTLTPHTTETTTGHPHEGEDSLADQGGEGLNLQGGPHNDEEVTTWEILGQ